MTALQDIERNNKQWFIKAPFFGDISYELGITNSCKPVLINYTNAWTDLLDGVKKPHYRIHLIGEQLKIGGLVDEIFPTKEDVKRWLNEN